MGERHSSLLQATNTSVQVLRSDDAAVWIQKTDRIQLRACGPRQTIASENELIAQPTRVFTAFSVSAFSEETQGLLGLQEPSETVRKNSHGALRCDG